MTFTVTTQSSWKYLQMVNCRLGLWPLWEFQSSNRVKALPCHKINIPPWVGWVEVVLPAFPPLLIKKSTWKHIFAVFCLLSFLPLKDTLHSEHYDVLLIMLKVTHLMSTQVILSLKTIKKLTRTANMKKMTTCDNFTWRNISPSRRWLSYVRKSLLYGPLSISSSFSLDMATWK